jgi:formamidopyrimidine-DNA glycosylase
VAWARTVGGSAEDFKRHVEGARVSDVRRRGKYRLFALERDGKYAGSMLGHLRMTGRMQVEPRGGERSPYERVRLELDDGRDFVFVDVRKFGRLTYLEPMSFELEHLGPEPLDKEFRASHLHANLRSRRRLLKPLLLDQTVVAGLGNIYVDEALHAARLHPLTMSHRVDEARSTALHAAIQRILKKAIKRQGSSFDTFYRTPEGQPGSYQAEFQVYGRAGKPCRTCGAKIERTVVGQRGTHFCPRCQPAPRVPKARKRKKPLPTPRLR